VDFTVIVIRHFVLLSRLPVGTSGVASTKMYPNTRGVGVSMAALNCLYVQSDTKETGTFEKPNKN